MIKWQTYEDPLYDDDGSCVDEDADWEDVPNVAETQQEPYSPYVTANS
jgi:hypothetical protein